MGSILNKRWPFFNRGHMVNIGSSGPSDPVGHRYLFCPVFTMVGMMQEDSTRIGVDGETKRRLEELQLPDDEDLDAVLRRLLDGEGSD